MSLTSTSYQYLRIRYYLLSCLSWRFCISDDTIHIGGYQLNIVFDPPHLIKGIRNNFLNKNIQLNGSIAKWSDIVDVYKMDCLHAESRLLHKLTDEHVIPEKIKKMKVTYLFQL